PLLHSLHNPPTTPYNHRHGQVDLYLYTFLPFFFILFLMLRLPPISTLFPYTTLFRSRGDAGVALVHVGLQGDRVDALVGRRPDRSEEHTSELQSLAYLVCRLLLEKKKRMQKYVLASISGSRFLLVIF